MAYIKGSRHLTRQSRLVTTRGRSSDPLSAKIFFATGEVACNGSDLVWRRFGERFCDRVQCLIPACRNAAFRRGAHRVDRGAVFADPSGICRVLSEIHSSFTDSLVRGRMRMTSRPRVSTRIAEPTASIASIDSVLPQLPGACIVCPSGGVSARRQDKDRRRWRTSPRACPARDRS